MWALAAAARGARWGGRHGRAAQGARQAGRASRSRRGAHGQARASPASAELRAHSSGNRVLSALSHAVSRILTSRSRCTGTLGHATGWPRLPQPRRSPWPGAPACLAVCPSLGVVCIGQAVLQSQRQSDQHAQMQPRRRSWAGAPSHSQCCAASCALCVVWHVVCPETSPEADAWAHSVVRLRVAELCVVLCMLSITCCEQTGPGQGDQRARAWQGGQPHCDLACALHMSAGPGWPHPTPKSAGPVQPASMLPADAPQACQCIPQQLCAHAGCH